MRLYIADLIKPDKAQWLIDRIAQALESHKLLIEEYELGSRDVKALPDDGPENPIWFEGRIQALGFSVTRIWCCRWPAIFQSGMLLKSSCGN